jgi:hypothetical protein
VQVYISQVYISIDLATVFKTVGGREAAVELTGKYLFTACLEKQWPGR